MILLSIDLYSASSKYMIEAKMGVPTVLVIGGAGGQGVPIVEREFRFSGPSYCRTELLQISVSMVIMYAYSLGMPILNMHGSWLA